MSPFEKAKSCDYWPYYKDQYWESLVRRLAEAQDVEIFISGSSAKRRNGSERKRCQLRLERSQCVRPGVDS